EGVQEDVLDQVFNFAARHSRQQDSVYERRVELVKLSKHVAIAREDRTHNHGLRRYLGPARLGCVGAGWSCDGRDLEGSSIDRSFSLTGHNKHVRCGFEFIHCTVSFGNLRGLIRLTPIKTEETGIVLTENR